MLFVNLRSVLSIIARGGHVLVPTQPKGSLRDQHFRIPQDHGIKYLHLDDWPSPPFIGVKYCQ